MTLERRLVKLEAAKGAQPNPSTDEAFAARVVALDRLGARKTAGDVTAEIEIKALAAALEGGAE